MPNILYALSNPAMPGMVKIGITNRADIQDRMNDLYSTGVPLPFDCIIAWELASHVTASDVEQALHSAFDPHRVNPGREFFELDPENILPLVQLLPGRDITPTDTEQADEAKGEDRTAAAAFKRQRSQTDEAEFLAALTTHERIVNERVLTLVKQNGLELRWGGKAFTVYVKANDAVICRGYPSTARRTGLYLDLRSLHEKANVPQTDLTVLETSADQTGLFQRIGAHDNLVVRTDREWDEQMLQSLIGWLQAVIQKVREHASVPNS